MSRLLLWTRTMTETSWKERIPILTCKYTYVVFEIFIVVFITDIILHFLDCSMCLRLLSAMKGKRGCVLLTTCLPVYIFVCVGVFYILNY